MHHTLRLSGPVPMIAAALLLPLLPTLSLANGGGLIAGVPADLLRIAPGSVKILLEGVNVSHATGDAAGRVHAATEGKGLATLEPGKTAWTYRTKASGGLPDDSLTRVRVVEGALWIGTASSGIVKIDGATVTRFTAAAGTLPEDHVHELVVFAGKLWALTDLGIATLDGGKFVAPTFKDAAFPAGQPSAMTVTPDGHLWIGTEDSDVAVYDGKAWKSWSLRGRIQGRVVRGVCPAGDQLWIGTFGGLAGFFPATGRLDDESTEKPGLFPTRMMTTIDPAPGMLLIGTGGAGLYRHELATKSWRVYDASNGLPGPIINAVTVEGTRALVATRTGLAAIDLAAPLPATKAPPGPGPATKTPPSATPSPR